MSEREDENSIEARVPEVKRLRDQLADVTTARDLYLQRWHEEYARVEAAEAHEQDAHRAWNEAKGEAFKLRSRVEALEIERDELLLEIEAKVRTEDRLKGALRDSAESAHKYLRHKGLNGNTADWMTCRMDTCRAARAALAGEPTPKERKGGGDALYFDVDEAGESDPPTTCPTCKSERQTRLLYGCTMKADPWHTVPTCDHTGDCDHGYPATVPTGTDTKEDA